MANENTLFLGNGFSKVIYKDIPSWQNLLVGNNQQISAIKDNTILYEIKLVKDFSEEKSEAEVKQELVQCLKENICSLNIRDSIRGIKELGIFLKENNVHNIITTNYDKGIELILCEMCGYQEDERPAEFKEEEVYSIRTYKSYTNKAGDHTIKLWKIHGDVDRAASITLGFDQYCGIVSKLSDYIKGKYQSDDPDGPRCDVPMTNKCQEHRFDDLSWVELFFKSNVYIVGFGMAFSEIDIWWLLNKRSRIRKALGHKINSIYYVYNETYDQLEEKSDIIQALNAFGVEHIGIRSDENYIYSIFEKINIDNKQ